MKLSYYVCACIKCTIDHGLVNSIFFAFSIRYSFSELLRVFKVFFTLLFPLEVFTKSFLILSFALKLTLIHITIRYGFFILFLSLLGSFFISSVRIEYFSAKLLNPTVPIIVLSLVYALHNYRIIYISCLSFYIRFGSSKKGCIFVEFFMISLSSCLKSRCVSLSSSVCFLLNYLIKSICSRLDYRNYRLAHLFKRRLNSLYTTC